VEGEDGTMSLFDYILHGQKTKKRKITKREFGTEWPFTIDEGVLIAKGSNGGEIVLEASGQKYAVNGIAKQTHKYRAVEEIWAYDPVGHEIRKDIGKIIHLGTLLLR
jgi:hypothetical protein